MSAVHRKKRSGQSLLELVAASFILAITIVPGLRMMRDSMKNSREVEIATVMTTFSSSKMDEYVAKVAADWDTTNYQGDFSTEGYTEVRYTMVATDNPASGGITDRLMVVYSTIYHDQDGDDAFDTGEPYVLFSTKISKLAVYQYEASS